MNETDRVEAVDRWGEAAGRALDAALGDVVPPPLSARVVRRRARWVPLLVAAGLVAVALVAAALVSLPSDEGTVAGEGDQTFVSGSTRVVLDAPEELGLRVQAAAHGNRGYGVDPWDVGVTKVHVPGDDWDRAVMVTTGDDHDFLLRGVVVDIGGPDAVRPTFDGSGVLWRQHGRMHNVIGDVGDDALCEIAAEAVASGWDGTGALPGHRLAFTGTSIDAFPLFEPDLLPPGSGAVSYEHEDGFDFVVSWQPGSEVRWRAELAAGTERRDVTIGGRDAISAVYWQSLPLRVASWLEPDGTIVRVGTYGDLDRVLDLVDDRLVSVDESAFRALVDTSPPRDGLGMFRYGNTAPRVDLWDASHPWGDDPGLRVLANVRIDDGRRAFLLGVTRSAEGIVTMNSYQSTPRSAGGTSLVVPSFDLPLLHPSEATTTSNPDPVRMVAGIVPDGWSILGVIDRDTGRSLQLIDEQHAPIDGTASSAWVLTVAVDGFSEQPLEIRMSDPNGNEQRYWT